MLDNFNMFIASLKSTESWFIFFDYKDDASNSIRLEISNLVDKTELNNVRVGIVDIKNSPCTVLRFNLSPRTFSLAYFKMTKGKKYRNKYYIDEQGVEIVRSFIKNSLIQNNRELLFTYLNIISRSKCMFTMVQRDMTKCIILYSKDIWHSQS